MIVCGALVGANNDDHDRDNADRGCNPIKVSKAVKVSREAQDSCGEALYSKEVIACKQHLTMLTLLLKKIFWLFLTFVFAGAAA